MSLGESGKPAPGDRRRLASRRRTLVFVVLGVIAAPLAVAAVLSPLPLLLAAGLELCQPPSSAQLERQRQFVIAHLPDARSFDLGHQDCDDDGRGYVEFQTRLAPSKAAGRFLADAACAPPTESPGSDASVDCLSDGVQVLIELDATKTGTDGFLNLPPL